jgi:hypothetical protein
VLALSACSAKSVEVSTETTMDPTVTAEVPPTTVAKLDRIKQCQTVLTDGMAQITARLDEGMRLYTAKQPGLYEAREAAPVMALQTAARCQELLPECTTPAADWVQSVKYWAETRVGQFVAAANGGTRFWPNPEPVNTVRTDCF